MTINWREIWNDPVWSKVISAVILLTLGFLIVTAFPNWQESLTTWLKSELKISVWFLILILVILLSIFILHFYVRGSENQINLTSVQWFSEINQQIKDCNFARIYLREFAHPDQFRPEHRESLLSFMRSLVERLEAGADIQIIAYHTSSSEKSGIDWLNSEIKDNKKFLEKVKLIRVQPVSNSSSMYLFDSGVVLYNRRLKENNSYHLENLQGSIVHFLIKCGFSASQKELP